MTNEPTPTKDGEMPSIFCEQISRKPNLYPWTEQYIDAMHEGHWTHKEFDFQSDVHDFKTLLTEQEREIIKKTLSAIGQIEISVKKFWAKLGDNLPHPSLTDLGYVMANIEVIHNNAYEHLLTVLGIEDIFEQNLKVKVIKGRVNYLRKYLHRHYKDARQQYVYALILFTLFIENVSLFSQFYIIRWFGRYKNVLKDTNQQVKYTRLEEDIHAQAGIRIINEIRKEHPELFTEELEQRIRAEIQEALGSESEIIRWILGDYKQEHLDVELVEELVKSRMNDSMKQIGFAKLYTINRELRKEFNWFDVELIGNTSTDFFHGRPVEYAKKNKSFSVATLFPDDTYQRSWVSPRQ